MARMSIVAAISRVFDSFPRKIPINSGFLVWRGLPNLVSMAQRGSALPRAPCFSTGDLHHGKGTYHSYVETFGGEDRGESRGPEKAGRDDPRRSRVPRRQELEERREDSHRRPRHLAGTAPQGPHGS